MKAQHRFDVMWNEDQSRGGVSRIFAFLSYGCLALLSQSVFEPIMTGQCFPMSFDILMLFSLNSPYQSRYISSTGGKDKGFLAAGSQ